MRTIGKFSLPMPRAETTEEASVWSNVAKRA